MSNITVSFSAGTQAELLTIIAGYLGATGAPEADATTAPKTTAAKSTRTTAAKTAKVEAAKAEPEIDYETQVKPLFVKLAAMPKGKERIAAVIDSFGVKKASDVAASEMANLKAAIEKELAVEVQSAEEDDDNF